MDDVKNKSLLISSSKYDSEFEDFTIQTDKILLEDKSTDSFEHCTREIQTDKILMKSTISVNKIDEDLVNSIINIINDNNNSSNGIFKKFDSFYITNQILISLIKQIKLQV